MCLVGPAGYVRGSVAILSPGLSMTKQFKCQGPAGHPVKNPLSIQLIKDVRVVHAGALAAIRQSRIGWLALSFQRLDEAR